MKSIILLAMSTLNANVFSKSLGDDFSVAGETDTQIKDCKSQLEPVIRYFLKDEQCTDTVEVLMLCTRQTLETVTDHNGKKINGVSAVTFLMDRINNCPEKKKEITYQAFPLYRERIKESLPEIDCKKVLPNTYKGIGESKTEKNALSYARAYEEAYPPDYLSGIREIIQTIRNVVKANRNEQQNQTTPFYIVTHGGPRDVMLSLNAVISLLDEEGIEPTKICGTNLATKMIEDQKASFDMFRFVSGMRDFLNFGNVDMLQRYYSDSTTFMYGADRQEGNKKFQDSLLNAMNKVSVGVQYSNPESYHEGLDALNKVMTSENDIHFFNSNLGIFKDTLQSDFGSLLDTKKRTRIDMVERCINKKQYQQALILLESALPEYYRENGIISFSFDAEKHSKKFNNFINDRILFKDKHESPRKIIAGFCSTISNNGEWKEAVIDGTDWKENLEEQLVNYLEDRKKQDIKKKPDLEAESCLTICLTYDFLQDILPVIKMHKTLKAIRNSFSHGNGEERPEMGDLKIYMRYYLRALQNLAKNKDSKLKPAFADSESK